MLSSKPPIISMPSPSWPQWLRPHENIEPVRVSRRQCHLPGAITLTVTLSNRLRRRGTFSFSSPPWPSMPYRPRPHEKTRPLPSSAYEVPSPTAISLINSVGLPNSIFSSSPGNRTCRGVSIVNGVCPRPNDAARPNWPCKPSPNDRTSPFALDTSECRNPAAQRTTFFCSVRPSDAIGRGNVVLCACATTSPSPSRLFCFILPCSVSLNMDGGLISAELSILASAAPSPSSLSSSLSASSAAPSSSTAPNSSAAPSPGLGCSVSSSGS
mmetsp:Transcript_30872/g.71341  ORF Transcript_30872/g.71341 Transcript_30872/m.71341 type:complete len:269 (+) Transcript_30872:340-1146(+)